MSILSTITTTDHTAHVLARGHKQENIPLDTEKNSIQTHTKLTVSIENAIINNNKGNSF